MARYKYVGEVEVDVPDLVGRVTVREHPGKFIQPGETFETDLEINNSIFELVLDAKASKAAPAESPAEEAS